MKNKIITLTGNFRKEKFFDIINQISEYFSNVKGINFLPKEPVPPVISIFEFASI